MSSNSNRDTSIYVGNIDPKVTKAQLYELFVQISPIRRIRYPKDKVLQIHQGYAFVEFYSVEDVQYVLRVMNNVVSLYDRTLRIRRVNGPGTNNSVNAKELSLLPLAKVFVKNVDESIDNVHLSKIFGKFGPLASLPEIFYLSHGQLRCAFVYFRDYTHSDAAIKSLDNQLVVNRRINLDYAIKENSQQNSKYGSDVDRLLNKEALNHEML
ncbi:hypothetical protein ZYGR_0U01800 [Zygosaccharomyces rouxii]|uniref:ZYRO0F12716p n=2 Tax=Zygosaccharomyces rouxii TaxID=4956 RepID=C5DYG0_ZYGRC|nr:uncharacterized protein ZYRO0F12716g [Zygosaccharomyces rouxii]KAH9199578.1 hypothetical protein LQ764DRAFT_180081 [Zygosaccharomyces rouxii]GAV50324.1 hypothetical protein ZYGR_0U01800 [Zygosaccharomyces rouxii]CAR28821.1 ZYRO0F12716p [Zygosaccharomyces rouxii]